MKYKPEIEYAEKNAALLIKVNKSDMKLCLKVTNKLDDMKSQFDGLLKQISEKKNDVGSVKICYEKFIELKNPIEKLISSSDLLVNTIQPFEMDVNIGQQQIRLLKVIYLL